MKVNLKMKTNGQHNYNATGRILQSVFPNKPTSTPVIQYKNTNVKKTSGTFD
jgi:hypothetical protein